MATKNKPGDFDCYANAEPDEPMFVLLGRDPTAAYVVAYWASLRQLIGQSADDPQLEEAAVCARAMVTWASSLGKDAQLNAAYDAVVEAAMDTPSKLK